MSIRKFLNIPDDWKDPPWQFKIPENEFWGLFKQFERKFGEPPPLMMVSHDFDRLAGELRRCLAEGKNLLPEIYNWKFDGSEIY